MNPSDYERLLALCQALDKAIEEGCTPCTLSALDGEESYGNHLHIFQGMKEQLESVEGKQQLLFQKVEELGEQLKQERKLGRRLFLGYCLSIAAGATLTLSLGIYNKYFRGYDPKLIWDVRINALDAGLLSQRERFDYAIWAWRHKLPHVPFMPRFVFEEVDEWRYLCLSNPEESLALIKHVLKHPEPWLCDKVMAAFLLISTLANSNDPCIKEWARELVYGVRDIYGDSYMADTYEKYAMPRTYYWFNAEASGSPSDIKQCNVFISRHHTEPELQRHPHWDLKLNRDYYQTSDRTIVLIQEKKLESKSTRDQHTVDIRGLMLKHFLKYSRVKDGNQRGIL